MKRTGLVDAARERRLALEREQLAELAPDRLARHAGGDGDRARIQRALLLDRDGRREIAMPAAAGGVTRAWLDGRGADDLHLSPWFA